MANECELFGKKIAFLSTPSIYFSLKNKELRGNSKVFDVSFEFYAVFAESLNYFVV